MKHAKVALVEFGGSHDECLLSQMIALSEAGAEIVFVTNHSLYNRNSHLHGYCTATHFVETEGKALADFRKMRQIVHFLKEQQVTKVVFNTAQGGHIRNLALLMPKFIKAYGIIHTVRKFQGSFTQKIIHRMIRKYVVLSDDLLTRINPPSGISVGSFYPIDFPRGNETIFKPQGEIWITITGGVETRRKDLSSMVDFLQQTPEHVRFIFLGKTDESRDDVKTFVSQLKAGNLFHRVVLFNEFISNDRFDVQMANTDFLLPLIHPGTPSAEEYISNQISGSFNLAYGYRIPLLIHEVYSKEKDLQIAAFFYHPEQFGETVERAMHNRFSVVSDIEQTEKWNPHFQHRNYLKFLEII